jgi:HSP20 family protein
MRRNDARFPVRRDQESRLDRWGEPLSPARSGFFSASPWQAMRRMQEDMDRLFSQFFGATQGVPGFGITPATTAGQWSPSLDISETDREWCIEADLPGVNQDDIDVQVQQGHLVLRAETRREQEERPQGPQGKEEEQRRYYRRERQYGYFERVLPLPENVDEENIRCDFKDGVLTVHVPKTEQASPASRRIPITDANRIPAETATGRTRSQAELSMTQGEAETEEEEREPAAAGAKGGQTSTRRTRKKS